MRIFSRFSIPVFLAALFLAAGAVLFARQTMFWQMNYSQSSSGCGAGNPSTMPPTLDAHGVWYSADCITYTAGVCSCPPNNTVITAWADRSGNGFNLTRSAGTTTLKTGQLNGYPAVTFSGNVNFGTGSVFGNGTGYQDAFVVLKRADTTSTYYLISGNFNSFAYRSGTAKMQGVDQAGDDTVNTGNASTDTNWHQMNVQWVPYPAGTVTTYRIDRTSDGGPTNAFLGANASENAIGYYPPSTGSNFFAGQIAEILLYNTNLTSTQVTQVETYLNLKYGL